MKRFQSIGVLLSIITALLVLLLVSVFANSARQAYDRRQDATRMLFSVRLVQDAFHAFGTLREEQGRARTALSAPGPAAPQVLAELQELHATGGKFIDLALDDLAIAAPGKAGSAAKIRQARLASDQQFAQVTAGLSRPLTMRPPALVSQWSAVMNNLVGALQEPSDRQLGTIAYEDPFTSEMSRVIRLDRSLREQAGIGRRMVGVAIASGQPPSAAMLRDLAEQDGRFSQPWASLVAIAADADFPPEVKRAVDAARNAYLAVTLHQRDQILAALARGDHSASGPAWMSVSDGGLEALDGISDQALMVTQQHVGHALDVANREFSLALLLMLVSISLASLTAVFVHLRVIAPLRSIIQTMAAVGGGDLDHAIPFTNRPDEIGEFARALCLFRDSTLEKRGLEEELRHVQVAREAAEASSRVKSEFLANMSHELRTPLNAILGFSDLMKSQILGPLSAQYHEYAGLIHESGEHLLNLVSDLLDIAKIEAGRFTLSFEGVELLEATDYCVSLVRRRAKDCGVTLSVQVPSAPVHFSADPRGIRQVLINLLSNAVKFTRKGGRVNLAATVEGGHIRIVVQDSGIGMSEDLLARIGRPFEQASSDPAHAREGTGLGLFLVRAIVAQHGGTLDIQSQEGVGTAVTVTLPLAQSARAAA